MKNILGYSCKLYIVPMREILLGRLTVILTYCTDIFYLSLTDYIYYMYNLYQSDIRKTYEIIYVKIVYPFFLPTTA